MNIALKIKVNLHHEGRQTDGAILTLETWGASGWRLHGSFRHGRAGMTVPGRGSYGMAEGKDYPAVLLTRWDLGIPTEKFTAEKRIVYKGGAMGYTEFEGYDVYFPTLDAALAILKPGLTLYAVRADGGEQKIQFLVVSKIEDVRLDWSDTRHGEGFFELAKPHTFKPVEARQEKDKFFIKAADGREGWGWITEDGFILSELNGVAYGQEYSPEIDRIERDAKTLISAAAAEMGRKGGAATSEAKAQASRENGRKGGRPKLQKRTR